MSAQTQDTQDSMRPAAMPSGIRLGIGSAAMVVVTILAAILTDHGTPQRMLVMAVSAGLVVVLLPDWRHGLLLAFVGYLPYVGFLVDRYGGLTWHGRPIRWELAAFALAAVIGLGWRRLRVKAWEDGQRVSRTVAGVPRRPHASGDPPARHPGRRANDRPDRTVRNGHRQPSGDREQGREDLRLTPTEWHLLSTLVRNPGKLVSRRQLLRDVWAANTWRNCGAISRTTRPIRGSCSPRPAWGTAS